MFFEGFRGVPFVTFSRSMSGFVCLVLSREWLDGSLKSSLYNPGVPIAVHGVPSPGPLQGS